MLSRSAILLSLAVVFAVEAVSHPDFESPAINLAQCTILLLLAVAFAVEAVSHSDFKISRLRSCRTILLSLSSIGRFLVNNHVGIKTVLVDLGKSQPRVILTKLFMLVFHYYFSNKKLKLESKLRRIT